MGGKHHAPAALPLERDPVPIVQEAEWAPGPVWTGAENLPPSVFDPGTVQPVAGMSNPGHSEYTLGVLQTDLQRSGFGHPVVW